MEKIGGECAGAVSILPEESVPEKEGGYLPLSHAELDSMIASNTRVPLLAAKGESRLSLAGAQDKLPVFIRDGEFFLTMGARPVRIF